MTTMDRHHEEIQRNLKSWQNKPLLRRLYRSFHEAIAQQLPDHPAACVVELEKATGAASRTPAEADQPQREPPRRGGRG